MGLLTNGAPVSDEVGSKRQSPHIFQIAARQERILVLSGAVLVVAMGLLLGFLTPASDDMPTQSGRASNVLGWTYFAAWSLSFYPQAWRM